MCPLGASSPEKGVEVTESFNSGLEGMLPLENFKESEIKQVESSWVTFSFWNQTSYKCQAGVQPISPRWTDSYLK